MLVLVFMSALLFTAFNLISIKRFGIQKSYSTFSTRWNETGIMPDGVHLWSVITVIVAGMIMPATIEAGEGNALQFLGFFSPLYLITVGLTPEYEVKPIQRRIHIAGALSCAVLGLLWLIYVMGMWYLPIIALAVWALVAHWTKRPDAYVYWLELVMFSSVYVALLAFYR